MDKIRQTPVLYKRKEECCGCTACYAICPKKAISMTEDEEGFEYPKIDEDKCIACYRCIRVCPIKAARQDL
ncbi:4Fe-4S binding protein [Erysipelotrichaceae bacterium 51-3]